MNKEDFHNEFWASLSLNHLEGLGSRTWKKLLDHYGSAYAAVKDVKNWPRYELVRANLTKDYLQGKWRNSAEYEWERCKAKELKVLLYNDPLFPKRLRQIPNPPLYLYYYGDETLLQQPCLAMVGSRSCTKYGLEITKEIAFDLAQAGITIVSGFAIGIDRQSHLSAMQGLGKSIAILPTGPDLIYPHRNIDLWRKMSKTGLFLTEFSPGTSVDPRNFPRRNRLISGISLGVLVVEAAKQSGSLITARMALEQDREVFAIPGPINYPTFAGCNSLIRQGAILVRSAEDILSELQPILKNEWNNPLPEINQVGKTHIHPQSNEKFDPLIFQDLNPNEKKIAKLIANETKIHIDVLSQKLGWESSKVSQMLLMLEMRGLIKQLAGMYYTLADNKNK